MPPGTQQENLGPLLPRQRKTQGLFIGKPFDEKGFASQYTISAADHSNEEK
jgi:hypothetical protein